MVKITEIASLNYSLGSEYTNTTVFKINLKY